MIMITTVFSALHKDKVILQLFNNQSYIHICKLSLQLIQHILAFFSPILPFGCAESNSGNYITSPQQANYKLFKIELFHDCRIQLLLFEHIFYSYKMTIPYFKQGSYW